MPRQVRLGYLLIILSLVLSACTTGVPTSGGEAPVPAVTSPPRHTPTATAPPTPTPTPTLTPTNTLPPGPTPFRLGDVMWDRFFFFGGFSPDCLPPCWCRLRVGISDRDDVQEMFYRVFGSDGYTYQSGREPPPGYDFMEHLWNLGSTDPLIQSQAMLTALINAETDTLEALEFTFQAPYSEARPPDIRPQRLLWELGTPDSWLVSLATGGQGEDFDLGLVSLMIYENGVAFHHGGPLPTEIEMSEGGRAIRHAQFCLGEYYPHYSAFSITEPLTDGFDDLTPPQDYIFRFLKELTPIQLVFGLSPEEITQWVMAEDNVCLPITVSD